MKSGCWAVPMLLLLLAACASERQAMAPQPGGAPQPAGTPPRPGETFLAVIGTPFLIAFKIPVCVASAAIAAPIAGAASLAGSGREARRALGEGLEQNCGPPYILSP
jgi:hypothetical protein